MASSGSTTRRGYQEYRCRDGLWRPPRPEGLARVLAKAGYGSRQRASALVVAGRVLVDGAVEHDPARAVDRNSEIVIDGYVLREVSRHYLVIHKPVGYDCQGGHGQRNWIGQLYPREVVGLEPAGRLNTHGAGLLLVSNDLRWNTAVTAAADLERRYDVVVSGKVSEIELDFIRAGLNVPGHGSFKPRRLDVAVKRPESTQLTVAVVGDHARKVRAVFTTLRHDVLSLVRTGFGPVSLNDLLPGHWRVLEPEEQRELAATRSKGTRR